MKKKIFTAIYFLTCIALFALSIYEILNAKYNGGTVNMIPLFLFTLLPLSYSVYWVISSRKRKTKNK